MSSTARCHWSDLPALALFIALGAVVLLQFVSRYVLNDSVAWTEEVARYLLISVAYFGSLMAIRRGGHIFLEVIYRRSGPGDVKALAILSELSAVLFNGLVAALTIQLAFLSDSQMTSVDLPKSIVYGAAAAALAGATALSVHRLARRIGMPADAIRREIEEAAAGEEAV